MQTKQSPFMDLIKQATRQWFSKPSTTSFSFGFEHYKNDYKLFTNRHQRNTFISILVYADDLLLVIVNMKSLISKDCAQLNFR